MLSVFSLFLTVVEVHVGVCVCICTHTHTLHVEYSGVRSGVGTRHLESPKNPDGLNLKINISISVYKVYMYMSFATTLRTV